MTKRGYTLIETIVATGLMGIMVASLTMLFGMSAKRSLHTVARFAVLRSGSVGVHDLEATVADAVSCASVADGSSDALVCTMPLNGSDSDGDGFDDAYTPLRISKRGYPRYGSGKRVWYYLGDASGQFSNGGPYLFRAVRSDAANPTATDIDAEWSWDKSSGRPKRGPFTTLTFAVDPVAHTVGYSAQAQSSLRDDQAPANGEPSQTLSVSGIGHWRNQP